MFKQSNRGKDVMSNFTNTVISKSLTLKLWRGERMCLLGMDVTNPEPDFVGFSIEVKSPGFARIHPFAQPPSLSPIRTATAPSTVDSKQFPLLEAPFQKFRWVHFPQNPSPERTATASPNSTCRRTALFKPGDSATATISLDPHL